jgi:hypothetical protein
MVLVLSVAFSLVIVLFDLAALDRFASPTLFWLGLRRGGFVPDPDTLVDSESPHPQPAMVIQSGA